MIKNETWEGSFEQEELTYNMQHNMYSKRYADTIKNNFLKIPMVCEASAWKES